MDKENQAYNLLEEPWVLVMNQDFAIEAVSLTDALIKAHQWRGLAGETETQNMAMLRFMLAILHTIFGRQNEKGEENLIETPVEARRRWKALWEAGQFPEELIKDYLKVWHNRFNLFDEKYPFFQTPDITGTENPAKKMNGALVESSNKLQLFPCRSGQKKEQLTYDEAARWLLFLQNFGDTAAKKPSPKMAWCGSIGLVTAKGKTLFETLMLNFILLKDGDEPWLTPTPSWEREKVHDEKNELHNSPDNQADLLSMPCRRVLLKREGDYVTSYVEAGGEYLEKESAFFEQMTFWYTQRKGRKDNEEIHYLPRMHNPSKQLWRDFSVIIGNDSHKPGILSWIAKLKDKEILPDDQLISLQTAGVTYGSMCCGITDEFSDTLQFSVKILEELGEIWQERITREVAYADELATIAGRLASSLEKAGGGDGKEIYRQAQEQAYYRMDIPFRHWLASINPETDDIDEVCEAWREHAKAIIYQLGKEMVEKAGPEAFVGKKLEENKKIFHYSAPEAYNSFLYYIKKAGGTQ